MTSRQSCGLQGDMGASWVPAHLETNQGRGEVGGHLDAPSCCLTLASPWPLSFSNCCWMSSQHHRPGEHLQSGGPVYRVGAHGCWAWAVCLGSLSPNLIRPGLAAYFCSPWSWVSLGTSGLAQPNPHPPTPSSVSWPHSPWEEG